MIIVTEWKLLPKLNEYIKHDQVSRSKTVNAYSYNTVCTKGSETCCSRQSGPATNARARARRCRHREVPATHARRQRSAQWLSSSVSTPRG